MSKINCVESIKSQIMKSLLKISWNFFARVWWLIIIIWQSAGDFTHVYVCHELIALQYYLIPSQYHKIQKY